MADWRLSPQLKILPGQNLAGKAIYVQTGDLRDLVLLDGPDAVGGVAIYIAGFKLTKGTEANPVVRWSLHAGNANIIDDDPLAAGATFLSPGKMDRQGLLFEVRGRDATTWVLRGYCATITNEYSLSASITVSPLPANSSGPLSVTAGTVIG
jgi:hypothetical protein